MSNASGIKVTGYKASIKALQAIGVPDSEIKTAGSAAGELVANEARSLVPVRTGALRESIKVSKALSKVSIRAGNSGRIPYANPIHWGWWKRHIKPNPFFSKALGITRDEVFRTYYAQLDRLVAANTTNGTEE
jgi:HK97 gp10 family phage protein